MTIACKQRRTPVEPVPSKQAANVTERETIRSDRSAIKKAFGALYTDVLALLFNADPIGINFKDNTDEYEPEVDTILPRLSSCANAADVERVVHEEFVRWFDRETAGTPERYRAVAKQIWERYRATRVGVIAKPGGSR